MGKVKRKAKRNTIVIRAKKKADLNGLFVGKIGDELLASCKPGRPMDTDFIVTRKTSTIMWLAFHKEGKPRVTATVTLAQLRRFMAQLEADLPELTERKIKKGGVIGLRHISPDITFVVTK